MQPVRRARPGGVVAILIAVRFVFRIAPPRARRVLGGFS